MFFCCKKEKKQTTNSKLPVETKLNELHELVQTHYRLYIIAISPLGVGEEKFMDEFLSNQAQRKIIREAIALVAQDAPNTIDLGQLETIKKALRELRLTDELQQLQTVMQAQSTPSTAPA